MKTSLKLLAIAVLVAVVAFAPARSFAGTLPTYALGSSSAPVTIVEYASLTCSHCGEFYNTVMPELEKRYIDTGKVRFIYHDFPLDAYGLHAATLAHCMPAEKFYPFIKILFKNQGSWILAPKYEEVLIKYAEMAGMPTETAKTCINDTKLMDAIIAERTEATNKYDINATPTFIFNDGADKVVGARSLDDLSATIDALLAKQKKK